MEIAEDPQFPVAESQLTEFQKEHRTQRSREADPSDAKMTFGQAAALHMKRLDENVSLKPRTRFYWQTLLKALLKNWPDLAASEIRRGDAARRAMPGMRLLDRARRHDGKLRAGHAGEEERGENESVHGWRTLLCGFGGCRDGNRTITVARSVEADDEATQPRRRREILPDADDARERAHDIGGASTPRA